MKTTQEKIGDLAASVMLLAQTSGLRWDEVVAALGLASNGLAVAASTQGDGSRKDCIDEARKRLDDAMRLEVQVSFGPSSITLAH